MIFILDLLERLRGEQRVYIQPHNFPDHDSVASAFGLHCLLAQTGIPASIIHEGDIQRNSLKRMISELGIDIRHTPEGLIQPNDLIVLVDGCKGNKNVTDLVGEEIAVIDHHEVSCPDDVPYVDIRPGYGACSTIIHSYYQEMELRIPQEAATALMIGINMDTALLTRAVSIEDIQTYAGLYTAADIALHNSILRNYIQTKDLNFYRYAIDHIRIEQQCAFCYFPDGCDQNLLGILGDFFLALGEIDFVVLCATNGNVVNFSLRNERPEWNAAVIIHNVLDGIGFGGGHQDMAGGIIKDTSRFDAEQIHGAFLEALDAAK